VRDMRGHKTRKYSVIKRYGKIVDILVKYEFDHIADKLRIRRFRSLKSRIKRKEKGKDIHKTRPERVRMVLEELGPTYIKLGQVLSMRHDLIPIKYIKEFTKLQDEVQPFDFEEVRTLIKDELGSDINDLFSSFEKAPIAAASIGQVHSATLKNGDKVVVKVQRPGIKKLIDADLDIMYSIAEFAEEHIPEARLYQPSEMVEEFERSIYAEMDYTQEGRNAEHFAHNFVDDPRIYIPTVYWEYTSMKVLTLEYIEGVKSNSFENTDELDITRSQIGIIVTEAFMKQVYEHGFFHADLHPGNIFIMPDGKIALIDFGMTGFLSPEMRNLLIDELIAITKGDTALYIELLRDLGSIGDEVDMQSLKVDIDHMLYKYYGRSLKQLDSAFILEEMLGMLRKHQVRVPANIALLSKGAMTVEGFGELMDSEINMTTIAQPFAKKAMRERISIKYVADRGYSDFSNWARVLHRAPTKISHILDVAERGYLKLRFDHNGFDRVVAKLDAASNRLAFSLIISAIIVGSSIIIQTGMEPHMWGVPMLGVVGFTVAGFFGMWLVVYILRTGRI
jgi:ubiquinone biosynthesis protein